MGRRGGEREREWCGESKEVSKHKVAIMEGFCISGFVGGREGEAMR